MSDFTRAPGIYFRAGRIRVESLLDQIQIHFTLLIETPLFTKAFDFTVTGSDLAAAVQAMFIIINGQAAAAGQSAAGILGAGEVSVVVYTGA